MEIEDDVDRMTRFITSPGRFTQAFNAKVPGVYRCLTIQDVLDMTRCGLIGHSNYYYRSDLETVRGILQYEQMRDKRSVKQTKENKPELPTCNMCGQPPLPEPENKTGRPKEYCSGCELFRYRERKKNSRSQRRKYRKSVIT